MSPIAFLQDDEHGLWQDVWGAFGDALWLALYLFSAKPRHHVHSVADDPGLR